ncbi:MAG: putative exporter of polyketide antibiotics [Actinomyces urogenitalis DORA_12]|uniref:Putative exporter of polyketide antibiotics n=1 Tax=Actinomyces urogenitalis DORA_12 TaxID=1403939 RepID=W1VDR1_9ACTO|nr:putative exporter of polyketide antibiotics [uncultured Actinomyces sp.]ETJ03836.1 MAG: putative exporter of polyketide antibiotics [Actinomyces urogenitalis DORA_12]
MDGFLGFMGVFMSVMISVFAILAVQGLKAEEQGRRTEPVLSVAVPCARWMGAWVVVAGAGCLWLTLVCGLGTAVGAVAATGQGGLWWPALVSVVVHVPEAWVLLGAGLLLYGVAPCLVGLVWALEVYGAMLTVFGQMMGLDDAVLATSVFHHIGQYPAQEVSWGALALMTVVAAALVGAGIVGLRRRDLMTA